MELRLCPAAGLSVGDKIYSESLGDLLVWSAGLGAGMSLVTPFVLVPLLPLSGFWPGKS